jgi:hypothetical protein
MAAEVEAEAVADDRLREAADLLLGLEHDDWDTGGRQQVARRHAGRAAAEHEDRRPTRRYVPLHARHRKGNRTTVVRKPS